MNYHIARPHITKEDKHAVMRVLDSGALSLGPLCQKFERAFAKRVGVRYACAVSSGTAGLHLALVAAGIGHGDEVITSPFSFVASANAILYVGAKPVFVDIDPVTYNMDPAKIEKSITRKTKAILVVHIFGQPADMAPILKLAKKYKLKIIEDACESLGATYHGRQVGTFGESAVFAFYPNKQITTGEGGMLVTNSKKIYELVCSLRNQGRAKDMRWLDHERLGYNYRLDEMSAALGVNQLKRFQWIIRKRRKIADWYRKALQPYYHLVQVPEIAKGNTHTWFVYVILVKRENRDRIMRSLERDGIFTKPYLPSIHLFSFYGYRRGAFPISESTSDRALALPFYIGLSRLDVAFICQKLVKAVK